MIRIFIAHNQIYTGPLEYIIHLLSKNKSFAYTRTNEKESAQLIFDHTDPSSVPINVEFYNSLFKDHIYHHEAYFQNAPYIRIPGTSDPDWLASAFYMVNSFQEYSSESNSELTDNYGRFRYDKSYQHKFDCIEDNLVQEYFDRFCITHLPSIQPVTTSKPTRVFLSHDIDTVYGSFNQDGMWAIKNGRPDIILKLVMNELLRRPHYKNIDRIAKLHDEHELKSTFFWLATKEVGSNGVKNADYNISHLEDQLKHSKSNGLHKSSYTTSFDEELKMLPFSTSLNRYHFLKFNLPEAWDKLDAAGLKLDASLGFAPRYGFRNNYGLPFKPYNIATASSYGFVEVPLNVMDGTLHRYMNIPLKETANRIIGFIEKNKTNSIISILWHNTYFTDYKYAGYLEEYKKVLLYLLDNGIKSVTPEELIHEFANDE